MWKSYCCNDISIHFLNLYLVLTFSFIYLFFISRIYLLYDNKLSFCHCVWNRWLLLNYFLWILISWIVMKMRILSPCTLTVQLMVSRYICFCIHFSFRISCYLFLFKISLAQLYKNRLFRMEMLHISLAIKL